MNHIVASYSALLSMDPTIPDVKPDQQVECEI